MGARLVKGAVRKTRYETHCRLGRVRINILQPQRRRTKLHVTGCLVDDIVYVGEPIRPHYVSPYRGIPERKSWLLKERTATILGPDFDKRSR